MTTKTIYLLNEDFLIIGKEIRTIFLGIVVKREKIEYRKLVKYYPTIKEVSHQEPSDAPLFPLISFAGSSERSRSQEKWALEQINRVRSGQKILKTVF
ncbi:hypothetical protein [Capnocytophaga sp. oral taxon 380]|uniref:hypothetical protein n=1 Tax=Capnocytophaga sp. oral taxon 380 TaxID=712217 RepID=UPI0002A2EE8A|nr:hypothetical protein [Capnocytophaga sp. oral taxon 380]EKY10410.1 hypothetical protein HMPREF9078_00113 [Capnocytophaga sp. oral taxon 380 str. F0488]